VGVASTVGVGSVTVLALGVILGGGGIATLRSTLRLGVLETRIGGGGRWLAGALRMRGGGGIVSTFFAITGGECGGVTASGCGAAEGLSFLNSRGGGGRRVVLCFAGGEATLTSLESFLDISGGGMRGALMAGEGVDTTLSPPPSPLTGIGCCSSLASLGS